MRALETIQYNLKDAFARDLTHFLTAYNQHGIIDMAQYHESGSISNVFAGIQHIVVCITAPELDRGIMATQRNVNLEFMDSIQYSPKVKSAMSNVVITNRIGVSASDTLRKFVDIAKAVKYFATAIMEYCGGWVHANPKFDTAFRYFTFEVCCRYADNGMEYHNIDHIKKMICSIPIVQKPSTFIAIMCHDIVYDINSTTNEEDSAVVAVQMINTYFGSGQKLVDTTSVVELILATKWGVSESKFKLDSRVDQIQNIQDLDLVIFSRSYDKVDAYDDAIRLEYKSISGIEYFTHRIEFINSVLNLPKIYHSPAIDDEQARHNLRRLIDKNQKKLGYLVEALG
jgi:predicted metal-dependent HD superfamily phosphohydrolase